MGWIDINDRMPPEGLSVLLEISGRCIDDQGITLMADHDFCIGSWIVPSGETAGEWLLETSFKYFLPTIHAWIPLPRHYQPKEYDTEDDDQLEHAMFEEDPDWLYKGQYVYEQMSLDELLSQNNEGRKL